VEKAAEFAEQSERPDFASINEHVYAGDFRGIDRRDAWR